MNPLLNRRKAIQTSAVLAASVSLPAIHAQEKAPIKILMGFPPGGGTDLIARTIAERLSETLGQAVIIDSKVGVGGRLAADAMMAAPPDGLTYMIAPNATPTFQTLVFGHQIKWDVLRDWTPVAALVTYPIGMGASLQTGVTNVKQLVDWIRAKGSASFGSPGAGGQNHFLGQAFAKQAGLDMIHAPYRGTTPMLTDLLGGHIPFGVTLGSDFIRQHRDGKAKLIGVFTAQRSELMPEIPTFAEQGFNITSGNAWTGMWAPPKVPQAEIARMQAAVQKVLSLPEVRQHLMTNVAVQPQYRSGEEMQKMLREEIAYWQPIIKTSGYKPE